MPCYSEPPSRSDYYRDFEHNSPLAEWMCWVLKTLESSGRLEISELPPKIAAWWEDHQKRDAEKMAEKFRRQKMETEREAALAKLSPAERKLLGIR